MITFTEAESQLIKTGLNTLVNKAKMEMTIVEWVAFAKSMAAIQKLPAFVDEHIMELKQITQQPKSE